MPKYVIHKWEEVEGNKRTNGAIKTECFVCNRTDFLGNFLFIRQQGKEYEHDYVSRVCNETCANIWLLQYK